MPYSIVHSGILGMKWGKRNGPPYPLGSDQKSSAEKTAERTGESPNPESKKYYTPKASDIWSKKDELSTQEINDFINRVNAEARLKDLADRENPEPAEKATPIKDAIKTSIANTGKNLVSNAVGAATTLAVGKAIEKMLGREAAEAIAGDKYNKLNPEKKTYKLMDNEALKKNFENMSNKEIGEMQTRQKLYDNIFGVKETSSKESSLGEKVSEKVASGVNNAITSALSSSVSSISSSKIDSKTSEFVERMSGSRTDISEHNIDLAKQFIYGDDWFKHSEVA